MEYKTILTKKIYKTCIGFLYLDIEYKNIYTLTIKLVENLSKGRG